MNLDHARLVADAVLYEGYLLYPYRATSSKNQSRWQWGVLGPPGAAAAGVGEEPDLATQCLLRGAAADSAEVTVRLRFLQLQHRQVEKADTVRGGFVPVDELRAGTQSWISWDEAVAHEVELGSCRLVDLHRGRRFPVSMPASEETETLTDADVDVDSDVDADVGRLVRRRWELSAEVTVAANAVAGDLVRLSVEVRNVTAYDGVQGDAATNSRRRRKDDAVRRSLVGTHLLLSCQGATFVSLLEPADDCAEAAAACAQRRCWPVLAGEPGDTDVVLASPIILYDYPEVAEQSAGALFDSTEIDEILTLRVMTLTDEEKAAARATDPRAAEIIDRCDAMSTDSMQALHGILRDPHAGVDRMLPDLAQIPTFTELASDAGSDVRNLDPPTFDTGADPWWDPAADASVRPDTDTVTISGSVVAKGSLVRVMPTRRADAQDLFFAGQTARVTAVLSDVDGHVHVAVVLVDDPAAELHDWYGRYLYFAPDELEPLSRPTEDTSDQREESRS